MTVALIHWNRGEGRERAGILRQAGFQVTLEVDRRRGPQILKQLRDSPPDAVVISLDRLPMQGRDLGVALRTGKRTRSIPIIFAGGEDGKVARVRQLLPDAVYTAWKGVAGAVKRAVANPPSQPLVPKSNLAAYSGTPLPRKLGIKPDSSIALLNEPENFIELLGELPPGVEFTRRLTTHSALALWFVRSAAELRAQADSVAGRIGATQSCHLWIAWPKRASALASDVTEQAVRAAGLAAGLVDYKVAAIDADWSGLLFAPRRERGSKRKRGEWRIGSSN